RAFKFIVYRTRFILIWEFLYINYSDSFPKENYNLKTGITVQFSDLDIDEYNET
ncbi:hypothetical protein C2G38_2129673, partial [Gigaspora rosea]